MKTFTLREIAGLTEGELRGDPERQIVGAAPLAEATQGEISFFGNPRYATQLRATRASAAFVPLDYAEGTTIDQIRVQAPAKAFEQMVRQFAPPPISFAPGVHPSAVIDQTAKVGRAVSIQPFVVIEAGVEIGDETVIGAGSYIGHETTIGRNCIIYPQVKIRERTRIGERVVIHLGAAIGADGFGFEPAHGRYEKVPQIGIVQIDDDVEIGANVTGVGVVPHVEIGDDTILGAKTGVSKSISGGVWWGRVAEPAQEAKKQIVWVRNLGN
jgi:UDP-3-O-[3-hydroxymyristoyl] glucosamine N-acyltransferase